MESPTGQPDSPLDLDDVPFPCQGCGEILEEGKAFELANKRWHIDCFRCNTCGTFLDSEANLLLLGDGSLICNSCTYSCSSCGDKIEDLAILTGDQAFCATCFKCRNCKRKIENLRYARTSQGIFCMDCHESLMARRRKRTARQRQKVPNVQLDKSLPSLPTTIASSNGLSATSPSPLPDQYHELPAEVPSEMPVELPAEMPIELPTELPSRPRSEEQKSSGDDKNVGTPEPQPVNQDNLILPSSTYKLNRHSAISHKSDVSGGEEFLIPVAFDPAASETRSPQPPPSEASPVVPRESLGQRISGDSSRTQSTDVHEYLRDQSHPGTSSEQQSLYQNKRPADPGPHKFQESTTPSRASTLVSPPANNSNIRQQNILQSSSGPGADMSGRGDKFKLQDVPKGRRSRGGSENMSRPDLGLTATVTSPTHEETEDIVISPPPRDTARVTNQPSPAPELNNNTPSRFSQEPRMKENGSVEPARPGLQYPPKRGDSLEAKLHQSLQRKVVASAAPVNKSTPPTSSITNDAAPASSNFSSPQVDKSPTAKGLRVQEASVSKRVSDASVSTPSLHKRSGSGSVSKQKSADPRGHHSRNESVKTVYSDGHREPDIGASPRLRYSGVGDFSLEEDMARILGSHDSQNQESLLKRVSHSVRHGRSLSDKCARLSKEQKWPKSPSNGSNFVNDISSPIGSSPENRDELSWYKNELRRERQKIVEKDQKISALEASLNATANIKQVNTELREKRSTMVFLDAQKEIVLRELEVLTECIAAEKQSGAPLDLRRLSNSVLREFAESVQRLKDSFAPQIEELIQKRNTILEELTNLGRMKDKSFQEFEQLSLKNSQLAELNNQLVHQIQGIYRANTTSSSGESSRQVTNGLSISSHQKEKSVASLEGRENRASNDLLTSTSNTQSEEADQATVLQGPQVISIRKGQVRKFNWKKGSQNVAKGVTKGIKGAFNYAEGKYQKDGQFAETAPYGSAASQNGDDRSVRGQPQESTRQGFGFFGNSKVKPGIWTAQSNESSAALVEVSTNNSNGENCSTTYPFSLKCEHADFVFPEVLFGTDLEQRIEVEKCVIPGIVTRCIEEVELRGMDCEGIYRKSGGSSQVQMIREGFEKSSDYDISDPDLDIHAVTSTLKQYFRKLPTPLITYEVYDKLLDTWGVTPVSARVDLMRRSLLSLPTTHRDVLEFLIFHLRRVVEREKENLMTSLNVAVVFAPTILRPESLSREMSDVQKKNEALQFLVDNCQDIFMGMEE
ncbi:hypothetical protein ACO22_01008 [Paracoccidioides brasiliensis]|uniref:Rho-GAP domain-containing protein n=1 Tax=Paracoccidioides brasiliensis TaxID=121759 RepID=A0A1D2JN18_PARBR|nr:hypothetical protein ACO22_01008 [Paracoccidioides brasiliensis]